ncbi:MAG TPA: hypothetical protein PKH29_07580 [Oscillospiraceae bacterium]|nr:hypothetical protein [Oscillospiraceae bacterium]
MNKSTSDYSILVIAEVLLACFVIYLPSAFEAINGIKYTADGYIYSLGNRSPAQLSNFYEIFFQKGRFMATGQFHNANALGFCSGMGVVLSLLKLSDIYTIDNNPLKMNMRRKAFWIMFLLLSGFVWCSAGTRGILLTVIIVLGLIIFGSPKISQKKIVAALFIMPLGVIAVILFGDIVYSYLFGNAAATSFDSRGALIINGLKYLWDNSLFGSGGEATGLRLVGVDPHVLPLKIATLYGVLPSVISIVLIYIYPIRDLLKVNNYKVRLGSLGLLLGVWLMSITDNMALTGLFWISMAESIFYLTKGNDYENNDGKTII